MEMGIRVVPVPTRNFATLVIDKKLLSEKLRDQNHHLIFFSSFFFYPIKFYHSSSKIIYISYHQIVKILVIQIFNRIIDTQDIVVSLYLFSNNRVFFNLTFCGVKFSHIFAANNNEFNEEFFIPE